jgi:hypothetical protein
MDRRELSQLFLLQKKIVFSWFFVFIFFFSFLLSVLWSALSVDSVTSPAIITYQGKLLEDGASVTTSKVFSFTIYDADSGGTALYSAAGTLPTIGTIIITPTAGIFSVDLGGTDTNELDPSIFSNTDELYLEVVVEGTTLTPRKRITASPYAINSTYLNGAGATSTPQSTTYIPMSDVDGSFIFGTTTFTNTVILDNETFLQTIDKDDNVISVAGYVGEALFLGDFQFGNQIVQVSAEQTGDIAEQGIILLGKDGFSNSIAQFDETDPDNPVTIFNYEVQANFMQQAWKYDSLAAMPGGYEYLYSTRALTVSDNEILQKFVYEGNNDGFFPVTFAERYIEAYTRDWGLEDGTIIDRVSVDGAMTEAMRIGDGGLITLKLLPQFDAQTVVGGVAYAAFETSVNAGTYAYQFGAGTTVPTDATLGWSGAAIFTDADASTDEKIWINTGDSLGAAFRQVLTLRTDGTLDVPGTATSTFNGSIDLALGNCFATDGTCISGGSSQWTNSGSDIYFDNGVVAIGTSSPMTGYALHVFGDTVFQSITDIDLIPVNDTSDVSFQFNNAAGDSEVAQLKFNYTDSDLRLENKTSGNISFELDSIQQMTLLSNGFVGIGTTTPGYDLDVDGDINMTGVARANGVQVLYRPTAFIDTLYVGNGGASLVYGSGEDGYYNTFVGIDSGLSNTTGQYNSAVGANSLSGNTTGNYNSAVGAFALNDNTTGDRNSAFGNLSLRFNTEGDENSAFGSLSLYQNVTGTANSSFGSTALYSNTGGSYNSAFGREALYLNTTGRNNSAFGTASLYGNTIGESNSAFGMGTLVSNISGSFNSAIGFSALNANTTGSYNNALGYGALFTNTEGIENNAFGVNALYSNTTGTYNIAIGSSAMYANTVGGNNIGIGASALQGNIDGIGNIGIGGSALASNNSGYSNTAVGAQAMSGNIDGNFNSAFGINALGSNTSSDYLSAFGAYSLFQNTEGVYNDAFGYQTLYNNTIGFQNSAFGTRALFSNTIGENNLGLGMQTLHNNTTGSRNIGIGLNALYQLDGANDNMAIGWAAMQFATSGVHNIGIGNNVLGNFLSGSGNTVLGYQTGGGIQAGDYNTIIGANVSGLDADLSNNIIIADGQGNQRIRVLDNGYVGINTTSPQASLHVFSSGIGALIQSTPGNPANIYFQPGSAFGDSSINFNNGAGGGVGQIAYNLSTEDFTFQSYYGGIDMIFELAQTTDTFVFRQGDTNTSTVITGSGRVGIGTATPGYRLDVVTSSDAVVASFTDSDATCTVDPSDGDFSCTSDRNLKTNISVMGSTLDQVKQLSPVTYNWNSDPNGELNYGFIAQDVEALFPRLVRTGANGYKTLSQIGLIPFLTKAIQEQQSQIDSLSVSQGASGSLDWSGGDLDLGGFSLLNTLSISGVAGKWSIDEFGRLVSNVETANGETKSLYGIQSEDGDYVISGSGQLQNGQVTIVFEDGDKSLIDSSSEMRVSITLTGDAQGVYVTDKSANGFTVRELQSGSSSATFDWVVITKRLVEGQVAEGEDDVPESEGSEPSVVEGVVEEVSNELSEVVGDPVEEVIVETGGGEGVVVPEEVIAPVETPVVVEAIAPEETPPTQEPSAEEVVTE